MTSGNKMGLPEWNQTSADSKEQSQLGGIIRIPLMKSFSSLRALNNLTFMEKSQMQMKVCIWFSSRYEHKELCSCSTLDQSGSSVRRLELEYAVY